MTCTPAAPFQCCVLKPRVPVQDFSHSTSLFGGRFFLPMLNGDQGPGFPPSTVAMEYPMFNRKYIFQGSVFHCYVRLLEGILGLSGRYFAGN